MNRWQGKVAVVTGASSGIGASVAADLVQAGFIVAALARREDRLRENQRSLPEALQSRYHPLKCDVTDEQQVKKTFDWVENHLGGTDVLINNAGIMPLGQTLSAAENTEIIRKTIDVNVMAVVYCVREAFSSMKNRNFNGHIVIVNSTAGHKVPNIPGYNANIYPATKFAVTAMVETYRQEASNAGINVKVTSISPGAVNTEIVDMPEETRKQFPLLEAKDVSNAILFALNTPPYVQVNELIIRHIKEIN